MSADRANFLLALSQGVCASEVSDAVIQWMWQSFMSASPMAAQALGELGPLDQRATLSGLAMPILSFVGSGDAVVDPEVCRSVPQYNKAAHVVEFENSGHAPFIEESARYNEELTRFLSECL